MPPRYPILWITVLPFVALAVAVRHPVIAAWILGGVLPVILGGQWLIRWICRRLRTSVGLRRALMIFFVLLPATYMAGLYHGLGWNEHAREIAITEDRLWTLWYAVQEFHMRYGIYPTPGTGLAEKFDDAAARSGFVIATFSARPGPPSGASPPRSGPDFIDAWGRPLRLDFANGITVRSAGPDGEYLTKDDLSPISMEVFPRDGWPAGLDVDGLPPPLFFALRDARIALTETRLAAAYKGLMSFRPLSLGHPPEPGALLAQDFSVAAEYPARILIPSGSTLFGAEYLDGWDRPVHVEIIGLEITVRSAGPDAEFHTRDDLTYPAIRE